MGRAIRLRELESNGFLIRPDKGQGYTRWQFTPEGADILPVLLTRIHFASKWHEGASPIDGGVNKTFEITFTR